jgi:protein-disulfide isomerase/uncharacterized membrane protein
MVGSINTILYNWLREMKIPASKTYIRQQLLSHPDYPSLLSITDTLDYLGIENAAVQIEKDRLKEVPTPFLAHLNGRGGEFVLVKNRDNIEKEFPDFFIHWDGVVVMAEKKESWVHELNNAWLQKENKQRAAISGTLIILVVFIIVASLSVLNWIQALMFLISITGVFVSWMIVSKELGIENKIADQVCGKDANCNSVIHSKQAKLPFGIGWSDAGIIYFSFLLMALLISSFTGNNDELYILLSVLATCAIPITLLSVYYQWRVIKKWCRLCLITVGLLWAQFFVLLPELLSAVRGGVINITFNNILLSSFLLFFTAAACLWLKPLLKENNKLEAENFKSKRFKNNPEVFKALLEKQRRIDVNPDGLGILLGNPLAKNIIIKVCNPYCGPCAKAHPVIDKLLEENKDLKVQIMFNASDDEKDIRAKPIKHLMALYEKSSGQLIEQALDDWYTADEKDYDVFAAKYVLNGELEKQSDKLKAMKNWCDEVKIEFTPTFFINGYQLPKQYKIEDVKYFL